MLAGLIGFPAFRLAGRGLRGVEFIAVVLHCESSTDRFRSAKALLDYGFANYALADTQPEEPLQPIRVILGEESTLTPVLQQTAPILIEKGELAGITKTVTLCQEVEAPVAAGQQLGTLTLSTSTRTLAEIPIIAPQAIEKLTLWELAARLLKRACMGG